MRSSLEKLDLLVPELALSAFEVGYPVTNISDQSE